ncbi:MAG: glycosyltransferase [Anaerolineae bacterium]
MAKFWFVSAPLPGHLDWGGYLRTAVVLRQAGHDVYWASARPVREMVAEKGIPFLEVSQTGWLWPLPPAPDLTGMKPDEAVRLRYSRALDTWLTEDLVVDATRALLDLAGEEGKPDVLVTDPFLTASALAAEALDVPLAVCGWPAMPSPDESALMPIQIELAQKARERIARLARVFGVQGLNFSQGLTPAVQSPHLHISYFSRYWHQADPDFLPQTQFVGGMPEAPQSEPPEWLQQMNGAALGLVTLGTVFTGDTGFFAWAAHAMARNGLIPLVVLGRPLNAYQKGELISALPAGTRLLNWVDYAHVFPRLKVIVHHGGMGTTHAAVVHGVPQVVVPHAADQRGQARRVAQAKVGLNLTALDVQKGQLQPAVQAVVEDRRVRKTARKLAEQFASLGGVTRAAELLSALAEQG